MPTGRTGSVGQQGSVARQSSRLSYILIDFVDDKLILDLNQLANARFR
jgi:hypothetical protein